MDTLEQLCTIIDNKTFDFSGYNETLMKDLVVAYALSHDILVDTAQWDEMVDYLWENLPTNWLEYSFENKEHFDNYMAMDLV